MHVRWFGAVAMVSVLMAAVGMMGCGPSPTRTPTLEPTSDTAFIETQVAAKIFATLTASAPNANGGTLGPPAAATPTRVPATKAPATTSGAAATTVRPTATRTSAARATATNAPASSGFRRWTVNQVIAAFKSARLEVVNPLAMSSTDFAGFPRKPVEGILFGIPSLCKECGGRVFSFNSKDDLDAARKYLSNVSAGSWLISRGNILVQLNTRLSQTRVKQYEAVVNSLP